MSNSVTLTFNLAGQDHKIRIAKIITRMIIVIVRIATVELTPRAPGQRLRDNELKCCIFDTPY